MTGQEARHRLRVFAAAFLFIAGTYLCTTRLYSSMALTRASPLQNHPLEQQQQQQQQQQVVKLTAADYPMSYGQVHSRPNIDRLTLLANLSHELVPTFENRRRLIVVGDIHGMDAALAALLDKVRFDASTDHLVAAGDMINKGPDSPAVISRLMKLGASAVRGNHEDRVLLSLAEVESRSGASKELASTDAENHRGQSDFLATGRRLSKEHVDWLSNLPVILAVDPLSTYVVHAGLVPGVKPENQDPWAVMNMRTLVYPREQLRKKQRQQQQQGKKEEEDDEDSDKVAEGEEELDEELVVEKGGEEEEEEEGESEEEIKENDSFTDREVAIPIEGRDGEAWANAWNRFQKRLKKKSRHTVVYGHDAKRGFRKGKYTVGLDSGCVKGGALTALIIEATESGSFKKRTIRVKCKKH